MSTIGQHYPKNPDRFEFDESVAGLFDNMARRSIPLYDHTHWYHADLTMHLRAQGAISMGPLNVLDVGASLGEFYNALLHSAVDWLSITREQAGKLIRYEANEVSTPMMERLRRRFPDTVPNTVDFSRANSVTGSVVKANVINFSYVIQFIPLPRVGDFVRQWIRTYAAGDCLVFVSQKTDIQDPTIAGAMASVYREFRKTNGYTDQEIDAKNRALQNSMWLYPIAQIAGYLHDFGFAGPVSTIGCGQFQSYVFHRRTTLGRLPG